MEVLILALSFIILLAIGVPIAYSIGISAILTIIVSMPGDIALSTIAQRMATGLDSFPLLAIPFFILAGQLMNAGGIARRLINFARTLIGWLPGALAHINILANMLFGAISGSAVAAASAIGGAMHNQMVDEGYDPEYNASVNISSATTGMIIPPSNIMIVYSLASGGVSIGALFVAGYIPGILIGLVLMLVAGVIAVRKKYPTQSTLSAAKASRRLLYALPGLAVLAGMLYVNRSVVGNMENVSLRYLSYVLMWGVYFGVMVWFGRRIFPARLSGGMQIAAKAAFFLFGGVYSKKDSAEGEDFYRFTAGFRTFVDAFPSLMLLFIVIGGIIAGVFTATEASVIAVLYTLLLAFLYREVKVRHLPEVLLNAVKTTSIVLILIATSMAMSWVLAFENIPQDVSAALLAISQNKVVILIIINLVLLVVGVFMDMTPAVLIFTPIFLPVVKELGVDPVHFGIIMIMNLCIGLCTPPVGSVLFVGAAVAKVSISRLIRPLLPLFLVMLIVLLLTTYIPEISLWLPGTFGMLK
ncbi:MAG: TRAP transporter large permease [Bacteroidia bacterium]